MFRRLAVIVFALGLLRVLGAERAAEGQVYPWSTKTPTRRPTLAPTRVPTATPTIAVVTPTPIPSSPPATPPPAGGSSIVIQLSTIVTGVEVTGFDPIRYEVRVDDVWYTLAPGVGRCWTRSNGACVALGLSPYFRITARDGTVKEGPVRLTQPRVLLAQAAGPVNLFQLVTPQIQ